MNIKTKIGTLDLWIPSKKFMDEYKPDYINFNLVVREDGEENENGVDDYLHFCWAECYGTEFPHFYSETLFLGLGNKIYAFTDETTWVQLDSEVEGWKEIQCNSLAYETLILDNFFVIHEESQTEAIKNTEAYTIIDKPEDVEKFKEFSMLLIGCTNLEIANMVLSFEELKQIISEKIGYEFKYF